MKKLNFNKVIFMILCCIGIGLGIVASVISLLTKNMPLQVMLLSLTYLLGIILVNVRRKYKLFN